MAYVTANARPEVDVTSTSSSYQTSRGMLRQSSNGDEEEYLDAEEDETVETLMSKLAIERRVQYGAEKMLDVIEQRGEGNDAGNDHGKSQQASEQDQVKERIAAQLEAANEHIRVLEAKLERLRGPSMASGSGAGTPSRSGRRKHHQQQQQRMNGYASTSSLGLLGQSYSSSVMSSTNTGMTGSYANSRPKYSRAGSSNLTPERERSDGFFPSSASGTNTPARGYARSPHRGNRRRSHSMGNHPGTDLDEGEEDFFDVAADSGSSGLGRVAGGGSGTSASGVSGRYGNRRVKRALSGLSSPGEVAEDEGTARLVHAAEEILRRLRDLEGREIQTSAGKGKERQLEPARGDQVVEALHRLATLLKKSDTLRMIVNVDEVVSSTLVWLGDRSLTARRTAAYRALRHILDRSSWGKMLNSGIEWLLIRTFTRDARAIQEREQAIRLLRSVIMLPPPIKLRPPSRRNQQQPNSPSRRTLIHTPTSGITNDPMAKLLDNRIPLSDGLVRVLVSVAENPDDPLRFIATETLVEIGVLDIECLTRSEAFRTVLATYKDGPHELGGVVTGLLMYLVNAPSTRQSLLPGSDLETALIGLTEEYGKVPPRQQAKHMEKLQLCIRNVGMLLASWTGLIYMCMNEFRAIKSLISSLYVPDPQVKEAMLDLIFASLRIKNSAWMNAFLEGKRLTVYNRVQQATSQLHDGVVEEEPPEPLNIIDGFIAFLLAVLIESGLIEALVTTIEDDTGSVGKKATLLLGELLQMANRILPLQYAAKLQSLPRLFTGATDFADPDERHFALSALSSIDSLNRNQMKAVHQATKDKSRTMLDSLERGQKQVKQAKLRQGLSLDDKQFQQMINDSGVLLDRSHVKWNYEVIVELIEGPLLNPKRLDETIKATKFFKRLFSFFHPYNNRFSSIKRTRPNHRWVRLGCSIISTLLVNTEGIRFLGEDKLLKQMADCFHELDQHVGVPKTNPVFSKDRIGGSLTYGYFEMVGTLSRHKEGIKLLERFKFFTCFYHLSEQRSRDNIIRIIVECFDYTEEAHPRIVLAKALTSAYMETRLFATHHLGRLLQEQPGLIDWALQLLVTQLYDTAPEVSEVAVMYLEEVCTESMYLDKVVQLRPSLEHLGEVGQQLFMRFLSTSDGFQYLHQSQYIETELETWLNERNLLYVIEVETFVTKTLKPFSTDMVEDFWIYEGIAPTHFLGELTKTPEGCALLRQRGIIAELAEVLRLHGMEAGDQAIITSVKSALWALGNIGSTEGGLPFLEDEEILEVIIEIAEQSPLLTLKGTCFFVISLLSSTRMGAEILEEYGWIATRTPLGVTTGICLPNDISKFAYIEPWSRAEPQCPKPLVKLEGVEGEVMTSIANLSNYVLAAGAMNNLKRLRNRHPGLFANLTLFHRAMRLISTNHFQAPVRRFILDLFEVTLESGTLVQLRSMDIEVYSCAPNDAGREGRDSRRTRNREDRGGASTSTGSEGEREYRRRSASSPGPEPPGRSIRTRGLTISEMGHLEAAR